MAQSRIIVVENRHHLLYPERAFDQIDPWGVKLRSYFVETVPMWFHTELHTSIDKYHDIGISGVIIDKTYLPNQRTLEALWWLVEKERAKLDGYSATMKLRWLDFNIQNNNENYWLKSLIRAQIEFFEEHAEELWR